MRAPLHQRLRRALAACALAAGASQAGAQSADLLRREVDAIGLVERLGAEIPRRATFTEAEGRPLALASLAGRPLLLSFNYASCPRLCSLQLTGLAHALREMGWSGERFAVVTVSIDPAERTAQLRAHKQRVVREAGGGPGVDRAWRFLAGSSADVAALAEAVGVRYRRDPRTGQFAHQPTLVVVTGDGRVSGYLHGLRYGPERLGDALARAELGRVASAPEQSRLGGFLLSCMGFDPADPAPLALRIMRVGGTVGFTFLLSFVGFQAVRDVRRRRQAPP